MIGFVSMGWMPVGLERFEPALGIGERAAAGMSATPSLDLFWGLLAAHAALQRAWSSLLEGDWLGGTRGADASPAPACREERACASRDERPENFAGLKFRRNGGSIAVEHPDGRISVMPPEFIMKLPTGQQLRVSTFDPSTRNQANRDLFYELGRPGQPLDSRSTANSLPLPEFSTDTTGRVYDTRGQELMDFRQVAGFVNLV